MNYKLRLLEFYGPTAANFKFTDLDTEIRKQICYEKEVLNNEKESC